MREGSWRFHGRVLGGVEKLRIWELMVVERV